MSEMIEFIQNNISAFDLTVFLIVVYSMAQCTAKGFMMSLLSFSKWLLALVITIILVPKFNPIVQEYVEKDSKLIINPFAAHCAIEYKRIKNTIRSNAEMLFCINSRKLFITKRFYN